MCIWLRKYYEKKGEGVAARGKPPPGLEHRANEWIQLCDFFDNDPTYKVRTLQVEHIIFITNLMHFFIL